MATFWLHEIWHPGVTQVLPPRSAKGLFVYVLFQPLQVGSSAALLEASVAVSRLPVNLHPLCYGATRVAGDDNMDMQVVLLAAAHVYVAETELKGILPAFPPAFISHSASEPFSQFNHFGYGQALIRKSQGNKVTGCTPLGNPRYR
ncbi:MAG: hypothetical protein AB1652_03895 [Bacillota bacterium]